MIFETTQIYAVNSEDGCLDARAGDVELASTDLHHSEAASASFLLSGVRRHDLAIFGAMMDESGVSEQGLLVVSASRGMGKVASSEAVELFPELQTKELARKFATLHSEELAQLGIDGIARQLQARYPGIKGYRS